MPFFKKLSREEIHAAEEAAVKIQITALPQAVEQVLGKRKPRRKPVAETIVTSNGRSGKKRKVRVERKLSVKELAETSRRVLEQTLGDATAPLEMRITAARDLGRQGEIPRLYAEMEKNEARPLAERLQAAEALGHVALARRMRAKQVFAASPGEEGIKALLKEDWCVERRYAARRKGNESRTQRVVLRDTQSRQRISVELELP